MSVEAYNRLKNEFTLYKQQSEETKKNLLETIKHLKESNEILKKEKNILSSDPNAKELKKLKEENIQLQKKLMDLEGEQLNLNNDNLLTNSFANNSYLNNNLITTENNTVNTSLIHNIKQTSTFNKNEKKLAKANFNFSLIANKGYNKIKESLKNKNEEITILKNELLKKEKLIENLKYKNKLQPKNLKSNINKPNNSISINKNSNNNNSNHHIQSEKIILTYFDINSIKPNSLYKNKSDNDFLRSTLIKYNNKYLKTEILRSYTKRKSIDMDYNANNNTINVSLMTSFMEDETGHNALEKNIYSEIKNILEEKRNFIIKTMTRENFSFDIINVSNVKKDENNNIKNGIIKKKLNSNSNKGSNVNIRSSFTNSSNEISNIDIDKMINLIKNRKKEVEIKKKYFEELRDKFI